MERLTLYSANANGTGAAAALPLLCRFLGEKGLLSSAEIEQLRHAALLGHDHVRLHREFSEEESGFLEQGRQHADSLWQSAALAAERPE
jgi:hypothetical protein